MAGERRSAAPVVDCPACGRKVEYSAANRFRPFCSERCRTIDLGAWASDSYVVGGAPLDEPPDDADQTDPRRDR